ncbi:multiprotein bridging factor aMBF1 [Thermogladius sp. 4427co]|uniref:multiprotein bridging factor aMBF1 n=1 Tax=Thermogladius sp. 4427co TaxID=3450718 RepID=UPI003F7B1276
MPCYCEMCGREVLNERECRKVVVEGSILVVCPDCYRRLISGGKAKPYVEEQKKPPVVPKIKVQPARTSFRDELEIVEDYAKRIKEARERLGWTQAVLASKVRESENTIKRIESGKLKPSLELARRLERVLGIKLVERSPEEPVSESRVREDYFTIGDLIRVNKK